QHLVGDVAVEIEQQLEVGARDRDERARGVGDRVGRALGAVEDRHLAEAGARFENGQCFLSGPGDGAEMRTSPSEIMKSRLPGSPSLKTCWPTANFCSRHTSDTRASSPSSRSWKIAACLSRLRFTRTKLWRTGGRGK